ncbi:MAG: DMT family transporter [Acetobacteraceae bacterium]|nr:DMT family transporter [Acetobacteraceae bacterium]
MRRAAFQLAAAMAITGVNVPVAKVLAESLPVAAIVFLRCLVALLLLLPLARLVEPGAARPRGLLVANLAAQAAFGTLLYNAALLAGLRLTSALEAGLVLASMPAMVAFGAFLLLGERPGAAQWLGACLAVLGIALLNTAPIGWDRGGPAASLAGNALVFVAVCGETVYALLSRRSAGAIGIFTGTLWMQFFSALMLAPFALPALAAVGRAAMTPRLGLLLVFHGATASVLQLLLWYSGMRKMPASRAGIFTIFLPAAAAATAIVWLGERATAAHGAGFVLMAISVWLATRGAGR